MGKSKIIFYIIIIIMQYGCYGKRKLYNQPVNIWGEYVYKNNANSLVISLTLIEDSSYVYSATQGMYFEYSKGKFSIDKDSYIKLNAVYPEDTSTQLKRFNWKEFSDEKMTFDKGFNFIQFNKYTLKKVSTRTTSTGTN